MPIPTPISAHNDDLSPDILTDVRLNYEWRRLVAEMLIPLTYRSMWSGLDADIDDAVNKAHELILDLYTQEPMGSNMDAIAVRVGIPVDVTLVANTWQILGIEAVQNTNESFNHGGFTVDSSNGRIYVPLDESGIYLVRFTAYWGYTADANTYLRMMLNGSSQVGWVRNVGERRDSLICTAIVPMDAGDYMRFDIQTTQPVNLKKGEGGSQSTWFEMVRVGVIPAPIA